MGYRTVAASLVGLLWSGGLTLVEVSSLFLFGHGDLVDAACSSHNPAGHRIGVHVPFIGLLATGQNLRGDGQHAIE